MSLRGSSIVRIVGRVDAYGEAATTTQLSTELTIEVRDRSGRCWDYNSGTGVWPAVADESDLAHRFDFWARDQFDDLMRDVQADGYDGAVPSPGYAIEWRITAAAHETQQRAD
jgi:hypothetical protein